MSESELNTCLEIQIASGKVKPLQIVWDLGCGLGVQLFSVYHSIGFAKGVGVDRISRAYYNDLNNQEAEQDFIDKYRVSIPLHKFQFTSHVSNLYELYEQIVLKELVANPLPPSTFDQIFSFHPETDIHDFLRQSHSDEESPDGIILDQVLHWNSREAAFEIVQLCKKVLQPGGWIYLRVKAASTGLRQDEVFSYFDQADLGGFMDSFHQLCPVHFENHSYSLLIQKPG